MNKVQIQFRTREKTFGREYLREVPLEMPLALRNTWLARVLVELAGRSQLIPFPRAELAAIKVAIEVIAKNSEATRLLRKPSKEFGYRHAHQLFSLLEQELVPSQYKNTVRARVSMAFRRVVHRLSANVKFATQMGPQIVRFETRFTSWTKPRPLIGERTEGRDRENGDLIYDAIPHKTIKQLNDSFRSSVETTQQTIIDDCLSELNSWATLRTRMANLQAHQRPQHELDETRYVLQRSTDLNTSRTLRFFASHSDEEVIALYLQVIELDRLAHVDRPYQPSFKNLESIGKRVFGDTIRHTNTRSLLYLPYRIRAEEFICLFILLMFHTGWNQDSLLSLTRSGIIEHAGHIEVKSENADAADAGVDIEIQGYKSKTDDDTPPVVLDSSQRGAIAAIRLLLWNRERLAALGWLSPDDDRIWFSRSLKWAPLTHTFVGYARPMASLRAKYSWPRFTFEQIRDHHLTSERLKAKSIDEIRHRAGHFDISSTGHYLDQAILYRLNRAVNREFQRRFERHIRYKFVEQIDNSQGRDKRTNAPKAGPVAIGDGASCADPTRPPDERWLIGEICAAERCHASADGCPNRRIVIDRDRMREIAAKRVYYESNWQRLYDTNPEAFSHFHGPAIIFNWTLYDILRRGPYRHIFLKIADEMSERK